MVKKLGCLITPMDDLHVVVTDGTKVNINLVAKNFSWTLQQTNFCSDMLLIPLGCCDFVLGIECVGFKGVNTKEAKVLSNHVLNCV